MASTCLEYPYKINLWTIHPQLDLICFTSSHMNPIFDLYFCSETFLVSLSCGTDKSTHIEIFDCLLKKSVLIKKISNQKLLCSFFYKRERKQIQQECTTLNKRVVQENKLRKQKAIDKKLPKTKSENLANMHLAPMSNKQKPLLSNINLDDYGRETENLEPSDSWSKEDGSILWKKLKFPKFFYDPISPNQQKNNLMSETQKAQDLFFVTLNKDSLQIWQFANKNLELVQHFEVSDESDEDLNSICLFDFQENTSLVYDFLIGTSLGNIYLFVNNEFLLLKPNAHNSEIHLMQTLKLYSQVGRIHIYA